MQGIKDSKILATSRSLFRQQLESATRGVQVFEKSSMSHLQLPTRSRGFLFCASMVLFMAFLVTLSRALVHERQPLASRFLFEMMEQHVTRTPFGKVSTREGAVDFLAGLTSSVPLQQISGVADNPQQINGRNVMLSAFRIRQIRIPDMPQCEGVPFGDSRVTAYEPGADCPVEANIASEMIDDFTGPLTGNVFKYQHVERECILAICAEDAYSAARPTEMRYGFSGYLLLMNKQGEVYDWTGEAMHVPTVTAPPATNSPRTSPPGTASPPPSNTSSNVSSAAEHHFAWQELLDAVAADEAAERLSGLQSASNEGEGVSGAAAPSSPPTPPPGSPNYHALFSDFITPETRMIQLQFSVLNPTSMVLAECTLMLELPVSGGTYPFLELRTLYVGDSSTLSFVYCWCYAVLSLLLIIVRLVYYTRLGMENDCVACSGGQGTVLVFHCVKCQCPNMVGTVVSVCDSCGMPIPALRHRCWRTVLWDMWGLLVVLMDITFIVARSVAGGVVPAALDRVIAGLENQKSGGAPSPDITFQQLTILHRTQLSITVAPVVICYLLLFRLISRGRQQSRFVNVFRFALGPLMLFTLNFLVTFSAFAIAFNVLIGPWKQSFFSIPRSVFTSFRALLTNVSWDELDFNENQSIAFGLTFMLFILVCLHLMFNVFPSVLTVAYKRAMKTPYYDADVLSLWFIIKPWLRKIGFIRLVDGEGVKRKRNWQSAQAQAQSDQEAQLLQPQHQDAPQTEDEVEMGAASRSPLDQNLVVDMSISNFHVQPPLAFGNSGVTNDSVLDGLRDASYSADVLSNDSIAPGSRPGGSMAGRVLPIDPRLIALQRAEEALASGDGLQGIEHEDVAATILRRAHKNAKEGTTGVKVSSSEISALESELETLHKALPFLISLARRGLAADKAAADRAESERVTSLYINSALGSKAQNTREGVRDTIERMATASRLRRNTMRNSVPPVAPPSQSLDISGGEKMTAPRRRQSTKFGSHSHDPSADNQVDQPLLGDIPTLQSVVVDGSAAGGGSSQSDDLEMVPLHGSPPGDRRRSAASILAARQHLRHHEAAAEREELKRERAARRALRESDPLLSSNSDSSSTDFNAEDDDEDQLSGRGNSSFFFVDSGDDDSSDELPAAEGEDPSMVAEPLENTTADAAVDALSEDGVTAANDEEAPPPSYAELNALLGEPTEVDTVMDGLHAD